MTITFANKITILRILSVPAFVITILYYSPENEYLRIIALGIFLFASISDVIDGYIARHYNQATRLGSILDPLADKLLMQSGFICLYFMREQFGVVQIPFWILIVVISKDAILLMGYIVLHLVHADTQVKPTVLGKMTTFFQVLAIFGIFFQWDYTFLLWWIILVLAVSATIDYIMRAIQPVQLS